MLARISSDRMLDAQFTPRAEPEDCPWAPEVDFQSSGWAVVFGHQPEARLLPQSPDPVSLSLNRIWP